MDDSVTKLDSFTTIPFMEGSISYLSNHYKNPINVVQNLLPYFDKYIQPTFRCVDIGAHIGASSLYMASKAPKGKVLAIEPLTLSVDLLKYNIEVNEKTNIDVVQCALGEKQEHRTFYARNRNHGAAQAWHDKTMPKYPQNSGKRICTMGVVNVVTLDELTQEKFDFVKIDTQGMEFPIFKGATKFLKDNPDCIYVIEFWPYGIIQSGLLLEEFVSFVFDNFSSVTTLTEKIKEEDLLESEVHRGIHFDIVLQGCKC